MRRIGDPCTMLPYYMILALLVVGPTAFLALTRETCGTLVPKHEPLRTPLSRVGSGANGYSPPADLAPAPQRQVLPRRLRAVPEEEGDPHAAPTCRGCLPVETDPSSVHNHHALIRLIAEIALLFALFSFLILISNRLRMNIIVDFVFLNIFPLELTS